MYIEAGSYHPKDLRVGMIESMCTMMRGEKPDSDLRTERESASAHKSTLGVLNRDGAEAGCRRGGIALIVGFNFDVDAFI